MKKTIVFFDIDGTLLNEEKIIPDSMKRAVRLLQDKGIHTVIATGRVPKMCYWIQKELNIDSYVSMNGQYVVFEGKEIYSNPINSEIVQSLTSVTTSNGHALAYCSHHDFKVSKRNHPYIEASFDSLMMPYPEVDEEFYKNRAIYQGHLYCGRKDKQMYVDQFPDLRFIKWHDYAYDILPKGASKAVGIHKLLEVLDINIENSFAFGDGLNDLEMLTSIGTGIAMGNAVPEAKAAADVITTSSSKDGILNGLLQVGLLEKSKITASIIPA
ncbi:Putative bifunctional phosphatase/peptidyl-prolyl cis-trans isomerase [Neobacillus rhizosphaerae]|uniref:Bifunctional phosphatase/peptidyl-prolyl cis-trans isomerase n=1 Tax=Neobacillus rhizosphaerae TaxID=2880965 RepID=A0ABN8KNC3_9BACI|nr:Cof-type HAD-IIB family hydrolase [Neobacillus rhizosphaerae]CAH2715053.1 Putative bifunctional phosphatase/peptidyl-prolyl cis-trans isomerase [Neobacillus rhizosphaerae]